MALRGPWANSIAGKDTTGASLGISAVTPENEAITELTIEETAGANAVDVSFDGGASFPVQIPPGESRTFKGSMGDEVWVKAAAATADIQWWGASGSP